MRDLDVAIAGEVARFAHAVAARLGRAMAEVVTEPRFGTAAVRAGAAALDLARLRRERYAAPGALPVVSFTASLEADLGRRDFSVNAVALCLHAPDLGGARGAIVDPFGGLADLAARRLRVLHARSFADDATRLWRGARTAAICDLAPDLETARLIAAARPYLHAISGERLWAELARTAERGRAGRALALADAWGVLRGTHPALALSPEATAALARRPTPLPPARLAALLIAPLASPRERRAALDRLAAPRAARQAVEGAARLLEAGRAATGSRAAALDALAPLAGLPVEARLAARWLDPPGQPPLQRALARWERARPALDAAALQRLGVPRSPALGRTLDRLRRARYLGTLGTPAAARRAVRRWISGAE